MGSMLKLAGRAQTNIKEFLESTAASASLKYSAVSGAKHYIYIPTIKTTDENGNEVEGLAAYSVNIHELRLPGNKYRAVPCLKGVSYTAEDGTVVNDGHCPFCERVNDAWDIVNYRLEVEEQNCQYTGEERENRLADAKKSILQDMKCSANTPMLYVLIYVYSTDNKGKPVISESTGLPEYTPKIWKLRSSRAEKMQEQVTNAGGTFGGNEMVIKYPDTKDARLLVSGSTTSPVFESKQFITQYPGLRDKLQEEAAAFNWEGVEDSFSELQEISDSAADKIVNDLFKEWDVYNEKAKTDPNVQYLEYRTVIPKIPVQQAPQQAMIAQQGVMPQQGAVAVPQQGAVVMPQQAGAPQGMAMDANQLFSGATLGI